MNKIFKYIKRTAILSCIVLTFLLTSAEAGSAVEKIFTIGVLNDVSILAPVLDGFKKGMKQLGYVEGKNVRYIYKGLLENNQKIIDAEIKNLLSQKIDMFLTIGNNTTSLAKKAVEGTDMPVLMSACNKPVESGFIESMTRPGGNITGVIVADSAPKTLEWMKMIIPGLKKVYLPFNPDDEISIVSLSGLEKAASQMGIELILHKVHSVEETVTAIENLPKDVNAILRIPSPTLDTKNGELSKAAIKRGIAMGARMPIDREVLITFASDLYELGKQTARLAHQIRQGVKPFDLPIEISDVFLTINLKTAKKIGLNIPDGILAQAKTIIR
jgi:putative tryptophan/tyrosine transport system substrate-binding protein